MALWLRNGSINWRLLRRGGPTQKELGFSRIWRVSSSGWEKVSDIISYFTARVNKAARHRQGWAANLPPGRPFGSDQLVGRSMFWRFDDRPKFAWEVNLWLLFLFVDLWSFFLSKCRPNILYDLQLFPNIWKYIFEINDYVFESRSMFDTMSNLIYIRIYFQELLTKNHSTGFSNKGHRFLDQVALKSLGIPSTLELSCPFPKI